MSNTAELWFKFYPGDWLRATRDLSLEARGAYMDCICLIMEADEALDRDDKWFAHALHVSPRKWQRLKPLLIAAKKLILTESGLDNIKCQEVRSDRQMMCNRNKIIAVDRENNKRKKEVFSEEINTKTKEQVEKMVMKGESESGAKSAVQLLDTPMIALRYADDTPMIGVSKAYDIDENSKKPNKNNDTEHDPLHDLSTTRGREELDLEIDNPPPKDPPKSFGGVFSLQEVKEEKKKKKKRGSPESLKKDWTLPDEWRIPLKNYFKEKFDYEISDRTIDFQSECFRDLWTARSGKSGMRADWQATFRNRLRSAMQGGYLEPPESYLKKSSDPWFTKKIAWEMSEDFYFRILQTHQPDETWKPADLGPREKWVGTPNAQSAFNRYKKTQRQQSRELVQ